MAVQLWKTNSDLSTGLQNFHDCCGARLGHAARGPRRTPASRAGSGRAYVVIPKYEEHRRSFCTEVVVVVVGVVAGVVLACAVALVLAVAVVVAVVVVVKVCGRGCDNACVCRVSVSSLR